MLTEQEIQSTIDQIKEHPEKAHLLIDTLYERVLDDIAHGEVKSIRTARRICSAALDSDKVLTFRYYDTDA